MTEDGLSAMPKHAKNLKSIHDKRKPRSISSRSQVWSHTLNLHFQRDCKENIK
jgi:hypothetical protein